MAPSKNRETEVLVGDVKWKVRLLTQRSFSRHHGKEAKDAGAITDTSSKTTDFIIGHVTESIVRHEVFHMYFDLLLLDSTVGLTPYQVEESVASLMGKHGDQYYASCQTLYKWLLGGIQ